MGKKIATESAWQPYHYIISCCLYHFIILLTSCSSLSVIDIDVMSGEWTHKDSGIGSGVDSYFEYLLKAALLFKDQDYLDVSTTLPLLFFFVFLTPLPYSMIFFDGRYIFKEAYEAINAHIKKDPWYVSETNIHHFHFLNFSLTLSLIVRSLFH